MEFIVYGVRLTIKKGDITEENCDAIVNAANSSLLGGGGVDGAIHRKAGKILDEECRKLRKEKYPDGLPIGEAVITNGGNLNAKFVIHTVGPVWKGGNFSEEYYLKNCFINSLKLAEQKNLKSIAFPAISTGAFGYPLKEAARASLTAIMEFLKERKTTLRHICIVLFTDDAYRTFIDEMNKIKTQF